MFPEAEVLHWIDLLDARMNEMKAIEDRTPPGAFSEKIMSLDGRRMYHPLYEENNNSKNSEANFLHRLPLRCPKRPNTVREGLLGQFPMSSWLSMSL